MAIMMYLPMGSLRSLFFFFPFYSFVFATTALLLHISTSSVVSLPAFSFLSVMMGEGPLPRNRMEGITYFLA